MRVQVLVAAMDQEDHSLLKKMNIQSDAIVGNQCDKNSIESFDYDGHKIKYLNLSERGVGLNRNNALMRADADIVLFADQDMRYVDNYSQIVIDEFKKRPNADMLLFNVHSLNLERPTIKITKNKKVYFFDCLKYGAVNFAVKLNKVKTNNIYFSLLFGGGAKYSSGEDSLFIYDFIKKGNNVYASTKILGYVEQSTSTWFNGYNKKYFTDKGAFFYSISNRFCILLCLQFLIRHYNTKWEVSFFEAFKYMKKSIKEIKNEK